MAKQIVAENQLSFFFDYEEVDVIDISEENPFSDDELLLEEKFSIITGNPANIKQHIPKLFDTQAEDVSFAENRFKNGKGYLFTNQTGTGKTLVGLGIAKRFYDQGQQNILIVAPTDKKCKDWIEEADGVGLFITQLQTTNDKGFQICVTTYANFYQNMAIEEVDWDLIIYDESHYLSQNAKGTPTLSLEKHRVVAKLPRYVASVVSKMFIKPDYQPMEIIDRDERIVKYEQYLKDLEVWKNKVKEESERQINSIKVVFLSATPFAYHKSLQYADGTLFEIDETLDEVERDYGYNALNGFNKFMSEHFGYHMAYNKLTRPEAAVDLNFMERQFFEKLKEWGVASTRMIEIPFDYSREFIILESEIGNTLDEFLDVFHTDEFNKRYPIIYATYKNKFNYMFMRKITECIKGSILPERIKQHLDLGRKVVIFHGFNNLDLSNPFQFTYNDLMTKSEDRERYSYSLTVNEIKKFSEEYSKFWDMDLSYIENPRKIIKECFPGRYVEFNGTVSKKKRDENIKAFNQQLSGVDIIMIQEKAGKEGISLHDKIGNQQRVLINIGLPAEPVMAIQIEGRIYREGLKSNAIYEYGIIDTKHEKLMFSEAISVRAKTVENLAIGNLARDLETAFKEGYLNAVEDPPNLNQGTGSKELDYSITNSPSEFQIAVSLYFSRAKRNSRNKSKEGIDYFATPEPLGYKLVEWSKVLPGMRMLEPSSGHGAIGRFFPEDCVNYFIEKSFSLFTETSFNCKGTHIHLDYLLYNQINKFDRIIMNPPFGVGGNVATEHIEKSLYHLAKHNGSSLLAIIPNGPMMNRRLEKLLEEKSEELDVKLTGEIILPNCVFERAGTSVGCKIIRIERVLEEHEPLHNRIDLSHIQDVNQFFEEIEHLNF